MGQRTGEQAIKLATVIYVSDGNSSVGVETRQDRTQFDGITGKRADSPASCLKPCERRLPYACRSRIPEQGEAETGGKMSIGFEL